MFERFSREARVAVVAAQEIARATGARTIDSRHLLAALASFDGPASHALHSAGVDVETLVAELLAEFRASKPDAVAAAPLDIELGAEREGTDGGFDAGAPDRAGQSTDHIPLSRDAKKAMKRALRENKRLDREVIDGASLVLGILRAELSAVRHLNKVGADLAALRLALEQGPTPGDDTTYATRTP